MQISINAPGWGSVDLSRFTHYPSETWLFLSQRERWIIDNCGVILTVIIHWLGPPLFLPRCSEPTLAIWSERLAKTPYQKNTMPTLGLVSVIYRLQIQTSYQLSYPGPYGQMKTCLKDINGFLKETTLFYIKISLQFKDNTLQDPDVMGF